LSCCAIALDAQNKIGAATTVAITAMILIMAPLIGCR
jgi:hypothetical protein